MADPTGETPVQARCIGDTAIIYAGDYLNKLSGERIERECKRQLELGCRALVINFRDTELVNSIGVSILMGVIDASGKEPGASDFLGCKRSHRGPVRAAGANQACQCR